MAKINLVRFLHECATRPSNVVLFSGHMGDGKTHSAIAFAQTYIDAAPQPTYLLSNISFDRRETERTFSPGYPPEVTKVRDMDELFAALARLMTLHPDGKFRAIWILDEAQNFMAAKNHMSPLARSVELFIANIRKFNLAIWMVTPLVDHLAPKLRDGPVTGKPGYVTLVIDKNEDLIRRSCAANRIPYDIKKYTTIKWDHNKPPMVIPVPATSWTTPQDRLPVGGSSYLTGSIATFSAGGHDLQFVMSQLEDCNYARMTSVLQRMFGTTEAPKAAAPDPEREQADRMRRGRELDLTWAQIAYYEGGPDLAPTTLQYRLKKYYPADSLKLKNASKTNENEGVTPARGEEERERSSPSSPTQGGNSVLGEEIQP